jgi:hypothetical protein
MPDGFEKSTMIGPVNPFQRGELDRFETSPWSAATNHFSLVQADDGFGQGVVVGIADAARPGYCTTKSVPKMINQSALLFGLD